MTQQEFAVHLGVSVSIVSKWESGKRIPGNMAERLLQKVSQTVREV